MPLEDEGLGPDELVAFLECRKCLNDTEQDLLDRKTWKYRCRACNHVDFYPPFPNKKSIANMVKLGRPWK